MFSLVVFITVLKSLLLIWILSKETRVCSEADSCFLFCPLAFAYAPVKAYNGCRRGNNQPLRGSAKNSMETAMNNEVMWKSVPYYSKLGETNALDNRANGFFLCRQGRRYTKGAAQSSPWSQEILNHWPFGLSRVRSAVCLVNWFSFFRGLRCQKLRGLVHQPLLG